MRQSEWVTRMARLAATEYSADWVINSDADEFWWPRGGSIKEVLGTVPARFGVVRGCWRHFLPRPDDGAFFAERMIVRTATPAHPGDKETVFHAHQKVAHRAAPQVEVEAGNHNVYGTGLDPIRAWHPLEVLHFSLRSIDQVARKADGGWHPQPDGGARVAPDAPQRGAARRPHHRVLQLGFDRRRRFAPAVVWMAHSCSTHGSGTHFALLRRDDGTFYAPGDGPRLRSRARVPPETRPTPPRRRRSSRSTASSAQRSVFARSSADSRNRAGSGRTSS